MAEVMPITQREVFYRWNPDTKRCDIRDEREITYNRPDQIGVRGGSICAVCGGQTRSVLDGEAWCDRCRRYQ